MNTLPYLRLVDPADDQGSNDATIADGKMASADQISLFSDASEETLGFIEASKLEASTFQHLLEDVKPSFLFDLRSVPKFNFGTLTRRTVFALFKTYGIKYYDVTRALDIKSSRDSTLNPLLLIPKILQLILKSSKPISGPVLFFVDSELMNEGFISGVEKELPNQKGRGWEISTWQEKITQNDVDQKRDLVFISHANPEDNEIALWLGTRLAAQGYSVWSDITRLIGGEVFWDSIENIILKRAACVIVLLSKEGHEKPGVLDEVNLAISTERRFNLNNFVVPVRVDALPFSSIRANLARKNIIDGSGNLKSALTDILRTLHEVHVPCFPSQSATVLTAWHDRLSEEEDHADPAQWNTLVENCISIRKWPRVLRRYTNILPPYVFKDMMSSFPIATGPVGSFSFASPEEMANGLRHSSWPNASGEALVQDVIDGDGKKYFRCERKDLLRALSSLVRQTWDNSCRKRGMLEYPLANNKICWFYPVNFTPKNEARFVDANGKTRRRVLVGRSDARNVYWHFGVEASVVVSVGLIRLKPHVVFTEDGKTPISSTAKQHSLRRGFCRNWWNDRWRDLLFAMLNYLSKGNDTWSLQVSDSDTIDVTGNLILHDMTLEDGKLGSIEEPTVSVGLGQTIEDPREGLMLYGPVPFVRNPKEIKVGLVSTKEGANLFGRWCSSFREPVHMTNKMREGNDVPFPGFGAVFGAEWPKKPNVNVLVSRADLIKAVRMRDRHKAIYSAVDLFVQQIKKAMAEDDADVDVWFVVIPEEVYLYGRPNSRVPTSISIAPSGHINKKIARRFAKETPSLFSEDNEEVQIYEHHADFHHQLKARLLEAKVVTQVMRESSILQTLDYSEHENQDDISMSPKDTDEHSANRRMQDPLNVSWNLATASFFKAGGRPWKVSTARPGVCYIGLIFKRGEMMREQQACCGAQMFLDSGEGLVFKGALGPWYSTETKQFHLSKPEAQKLMERALEAYFDIHKIYPREVFVHGRTRFSEDELGGFALAADSQTVITGVRITRTNDFKLYSTGDLPVKRGTYLKLNNRVGLLWTSGYIDKLGTYPGRETPNPLRVEIRGHSSTCLETVLTDIMTLTKMNFNSSVFSDGFPVTMRFADAIGDVLMAAGDQDIPPLPFRHYI